METVRVDSLNIQAGEVVLDLGCGQGRHTIAVAYHHPKAISLGLDLSKSDLLCAAERSAEFLHEHNSANYINGSGLELPFADSSIDHIICSEVLEHIADYEQFIQEISRVLKPKGSLSVSVPRAWPERICWALSSAYHKVEGGHVRIFSDKALRQAFQSRHFILHKKHWAHSLHTPYWWLRCAWWNKGKDNLISSLYHRLLVWDLIKQPALTRVLDQLLNPILGKSVVMYFQKGN